LAQTGPTLRVRAAALDKRAILNTVSAVGEYSSIFRDEPGTHAGAVNVPAVAAPPPTVVHEETIANFPGLLAGAAAALVGGLVWAGVVIATHLDIGVLAWLIGAATGTAIVRISGGPVETGSRILAGVFAAGGIMLGKYVIFVHALRLAFHNVFGSLAPAPGYFDTHQVTLFVQHFGSVVKPIYALWVALAFVAAFRTASGALPFGRRRLSR
jgi:hypothetical protein